MLSLPSFRPPLRSASGRLRKVKHAPPAEPSSCLPAFPPPCHHSISGPESTSIVEATSEANLPSVIARIYEADKVKMFDDKTGKLPPKPPGKRWTSKPSENAPHGEFDYWPMYVLAWSVLIVRSAADLALGHHHRHPSTMEQEARPLDDLAG